MREDVRVCASETGAGEDTRVCGWFCTSVRVRVTPTRDRTEGDGKDSKGSGVTRRSVGPGSRVGEWLDVVRVNLGVVLPRPRQGVTPSGPWTPYLFPRRILTPTIGSHTRGLRTNHLSPLRTQPAGCLSGTPPRVGISTTDLGGVRRVPGWTHPLLRTLTRVRGNPSFPEEYSVRTGCQDPYRRSGPVPTQSEDRETD